MDETLAPVMARLFAEAPLRYRLPNGLTVLYRRDFSAAVMSAQVWVKTGSIHEAALLGSGLSHYLEHMLFKGTARRDFRALTREVQAAGAYSNAYTTFDRTVYYMDGPDTAFETVLEVLADQVFCSLIDEAEAAREQQVILREIDMYLDNPDSVLMQAVFGAAYRTHPYRFPVIGERALFERVGREQLQAYYVGRYAPNNMVLSLVGALEEERVRKAVERHFGGMAMRPLSEAAVEAEPPQLARREVRLQGDCSVVRGAMAWKAPGLGHADASGLEVLAHVLGGGKSALLWRVLREQRQLVHHVECSLWNPGACGLFWVSYTCEPGRCSQVEEAVEEVVQSVACQPVSQERIASAVRQAVVAEVNARKTMSGQAGRLAAAEVVLGDVGAPLLRLERLGAASPVSLSGLVREYLKPDQQTRASYEPAVRKRVRRAGSREGGAGEFETLQWPGGVRVLLNPTPSLPKVHLRAVCLGGPLFEEPRARGATHLLSTLLGRDTLGRSAEEVDAVVEGAGGVLTEFAGNNSFGLGVEVLASDMPLGVELLGEALCRPAFRQETLEIEREAQLAVLREMHDEVADYARARLRQLFFGKHPYADLPEGNQESVSRLRREDVVGLYRRLVVSGNLVVAVSGDFAREALLEQLEVALRGLPQGKVEVPRLAFRAPEGSAAREFKDREQTLILRAWPGVGVRDKQALVAEVLEELCGGMSSRLFEEVREKRGMAYFVGASRLVGLQTGMFSLYAGTQEAHREAVLEVFTQEMHRLAQGELGEGELARCLTRLKAQKKMGLQAMGSRALQAALNVLYGLPPDHWKTYEKELDAVDTSAVSRLAQQWANPAQSIQLVVSPSKSRPQR